VSSESLNLSRNWWGKIIGAVIGLLRGGVVGAIIGALLGHMVDRFLAGIIGVGKARETFFQALFSALGHLSKADGQVTEAEIRMAENLMQRMRITGEDRQRAIRFFNQGKQPGFDLKSALAGFVRHSATRGDLRQMFMEIIAEAAISTGPVSAAENAVLIAVARELGIPAQLLAAILQARQSGAGASSGRRPGSVPTAGTLDQAYAHLGLSKGAGDAEVKKAYRKLVSQYHPDKLVSRGLPSEMMELAKTRVREVNIAYEQIKQARGFK